MERDIVKRIEDLMDLFDEDEVTTADKIERPEDPYRDFMERNPMAGGGMLVQPSADGSRPGYAMSKEKKAAYMREYYKTKPRKMTEMGAKRVETAKVLDEYIKTLGKVVNTDDLYKKLEKLGFEGKQITSKIDDLKQTKLKGKTFTKKTPKKQEPRMDKKQLKEFDKYAKFLKKEGIEGMEDTYAASTDKAKQTIRNRSKSAGGKFTKDAALVISKRPDTFTESQKNKIKAAFNISDADFAASGTQYGVPSGQGVPGEEGKALKRRYALVKDFVNRGFKESSQRLPSGLLRKEDQLPLDIQTEIKTKYELPEDYVNKTTGKREWDFTRHKYGVPGTKGTPLLSLVKKIEYEFVRNPSTKKFKFVGDFKTPQGWIMAQMYRSGVEQGSLNYEPIYGKVNDTIKIVGFTDNIVGEDFYVRDEFVQPGGKPMRLHPDFNDVKKFIDVANKANAPLQGTLKGMLKQIGVVDNRLTMTTLLNYLAKEEGYNAVQRGLVLHHKGGVFENATRDLQLLRNINNKAIQGAENRIRNVVKLGQTPDKADIKILKDNRASVTVGGQTFGGGPQTPGGTFRYYEKFIGEQIKQGKVKKESLLKFIDTEFGKLAAEIDPKGCGRKTGATGGRIGLKFGSSECVLKAKNYLNQVVNKGIQNEPPARVGLIKKILSGTGNFVKQNLSPRELFKLENLVGKPALYATAVVESGLLLDDVLRKKEPINVATAENFLFGNLLNLNADAERAKNIINDPNLSPAAKTYAQGIIDQDNFRKLSQTYATNLVKNPLFIPSGAKAKADTALANLKNKILNTPETGRIDYESLLADKQDAFTAKEKPFDAPDKPGLPSFTSGQLEKRNVPGEFVIDPNFPLPLQKETLVPSYVSPSYQNFQPIIPLKEDVDKILRDEGLMGQDQELTEDYFQTEFSQPLAFEQLMQLPSFRGASERFAGGGIAKIAGVESGPPPERGPNPQGLPSLLKRVRNL